MNAAVTGYPTDLDGKLRIRNGTVDLGAYEYINYAPVVSDITKSGTAGQSVSFSAADFSSHFVDQNEDGLKRVKIISLTEFGELTLDGVPVTLDQEIPVASLAGLRYKPYQGWHGLDGFGWNGSDGALYASHGNLVWITIRLNNIYLPNIVR
jgi:hypothetical protein